MRRLTLAAAEPPPVPRQVVPPVVAAPAVVPRMIDPVALRLMALQLENDALREELAQLRTA